MQYFQDCGAQCNYHFFLKQNLPAHDEFILSEESSKHIVQVLRMQRI